MKLLLAVLMLASPAAADDALETALRAELGRAKAELKDEGYPDIYYIAADVWDFEDVQAWAHLGQPVAHTTQRQRIALFDVRVGGPALDNHPLEPKADYLGQAVPWSDDVLALRHSFWRVLDGAYKNASADYLRKKALRVQRGKADYDADDLAPEPPATRRLPPLAPVDAGPALRRAVAEISEPLRGAPGAVFAGGNAQWSRTRKTRRDTDGAAVDADAELLMLQVSAEGVAADGMRQVVSREFVARSLADMPSSERLRQAGEQTRAEFAEVLAAPTTAPFSAPALVDPEVAGALVLSMALRLTGEETRNPAGAQTFRGRVGERVLSEELSLADDPRLSSYGGKPLLGGYEFDDQGVPARRASLIENGKVAGYLLSRYVAKGFPRSNGHARAMPGRLALAAPANLILTARTVKPVDALLERLRAECRRRGLSHGLWIRGARQYAQEQGSGGQGSIRVKGGVWLVNAETGALTRMRDLDLVGTPLVLLGGILAAGNDATVWTDMPGGMPVSVVAPSLLLGDAELQRAQAQPEKPPLLPAP